MTKSTRLSNRTIFPFGWKYNHYSINFKNLNITVGKDQLSIDVCVHPIYTVHTIFFIMLVDANAISILILCAVMKSTLN